MTNSRSKLDVPKVGRQEEQVQSICSQMALGIESMHSQMAVHRDVKPDNYLVVERGEAIPAVLLSDFGFSHIVWLDKRGSEQNVHFKCGTLNYMSPEQLTKVNKNGVSYQAFPVDIWALGCTLYYVLNQKLAFPGTHPEQKIRNGIWHWPDKYKPSVALNDLLDGMLEPDASNRLGIAAVLTHQWLAQVVSKIKKIDFKQ